MGEAPIRGTRTTVDDAVDLPNTTVPAADVAGDSVLGSSLFTRRYWGNPC